MSSYRGRARGLVALLGLLALAGVLGAAHAQSIGYWSFAPMVVDAANPPAQLLVTARVTGTFTQVSFEYQPGEKGPVTTIPMRDDGLGGDAVAGDGVYSAQLPVAPLLAALVPDDVNRVFAGWIDVYNGATRALHGFTFVDVLTADVARPPITRVTSTVQATNRLVNLVLPAFFADSGGLVENVTKEFYKHFADDYDFLNIVISPSRFLNRYHSTTKNDITGIGQPMIDSNAAFGSKGRLRGFNVFPIASIFDGAEPGALHEIGHQWISYLNFGPFAQGRPHWPYSTMGTGMMGISIGGPNGQGGQFACDIQEVDGKVLLKPRPNGPLYNDLELYMMGLLAAEQVRLQLVFVDQVGPQNMGCAGQTYNGAMTRVTAQDVVQGAGVRNPGVNGSPVNFRVASVLVTRDGLATPETMWLYGAMAERAELRTPTTVHSGLVKFTASPFYVATRGLATLDTRIGVNERFVIQGFPLGPLAARSLSVSVRPEAADVGRSRQLFVAALVGGTQWYFRSGSGWVPWNGGAMPAFATRTLAAENTLQVLDGSLDVSALTGTQVYAGYGIDGPEMLAAGRYALVHTLWPRPP